MKLSKYLTKETPGKNWRYVGTIWGSDEWTGTSKEMADTVKKIGADEKMIDHPTYGGESGYYLQSSNIHYKHGITDECVLELK
jgi:hypothetical protein